MSIDRAINIAIDKKEAGGWKRWPQLFWAIDMHDTIIKATYNRHGKMVFFSNAENVLKQLSENPKMYLILWTGTHKIPLAEYKFSMETMGIHFDSINKNSHCESDQLRAVDEKLYFDILIDDKAGFNPDEDWFKIEQTLKERNLW